GRYLAGDWGATLSLSRRFQNGWNVRGFMTRTDVSFNEFGEGSFAKGFEVTIPLRWALPFETKSAARINLLPSESDGGARLDIEGRLYERIRDLDRRSLEDGWSAFWQ
ncbi:MAG: YjbH domain-containing protein, partial [Pseudomonadota bacterium]